MRPLMLCLILAVGAQAEWKRFVMTPKGEFSDSPGAHPLSYFTEYPLLHDATGEFCYLCTPEKKLAEAKRLKVRADVKRLGTARGRAVLDVHFTDESADKAYWKSVLVQYGPGRFFEIYQVEPAVGDVMPSYLFSVSGDDIIATGDDCQRYSCNEQFFWIGPDGPVRLDFQPVLRAAQAACPKGVDVFANFEMVSRTLPLGFIRVGTFEPGWSKPSATAKVEVRVRLMDGRLVPSEARFLPDTSSRPDPSRKQ